MENPSFIRDFPLPECISPCEQPSSVPMFREFRANCIHEQQLWHGMVHLLKADENQASGARQSPAASDTVGLEPKKNSLVTHQDKQLRKCTTWFHLHIPYLHQESTAAWHISTQKFLPSLLRLHLNWQAVQPGLSASGFMQLHWSYMGFNYLEGIELQVSYLQNLILFCAWFSHSRVPKFDPKWLVFTYLLAPSWCWSARPCFHPGRVCVENSTIYHVFCKDSWPLSSVHRC